MTVKKHRLYVVMDVNIDMPEDWHDTWWKEGAPDWLHISLSTDTAEVSDLTVYNDVEDLLADRAEGVDMFRGSPADAR